MLKPRLNCLLASANLYHMATIFHLPITLFWVSIFSTSVLTISGRAQDFTYTIENGSVVIVQYGGPSGAVIIPSTLEGLPVKRIAPNAFEFASHMTAVTIPDTVTNIGAGAFYSCSALTTVSFGTNLITISPDAFGWCTALTSVTLPASISTIGSGAFYWCVSMRDVYFKGHAPTVAGDSFPDTTTLYYLPGTTNWGSELGGAPAVLWDPHVLRDETFGPGQDGFGFTIAGPSNATIVTEVCTNLLNQNWVPVATNILADGTSHFSDPKWAEHFLRFYRFRSP